MIDEKFADLIFKEFKGCVEGTLSRLKAEDTYRPFHAALLSEEALRWSRFERSFSTSFGQGVIERVSKLVVEANGAKQSTNQKITKFTLDVNILTAIDNHISQLRNGRRNIERDFNKTVTEIMALPLRGQDEEVRVISDLWWEDRSGRENFVSIKTVKPNIDQTAAAKRELMKLRCLNIKYNTYFGLYYNPYGEGKEHYAHSQPQCIFDFRNDPVVLIGRDYWNTLGGEGCYEKVLAVAQSVGKTTRQMIEKAKF